MGLSQQDRVDLDTAMQLIANTLNRVEPAPAIVVEAPKTDAPANVRRPIAWGAKVSKAFRDRVWWIADELRLDPDHLMTCMAFETGRTFSASVKNGAGSGATGLIQFMPTTATGLGTTTAKLALMTAEDQLNFVYKYFRPYAGKLKTLADVYMAILWPAAVGKPEGHVLWDKNSKPTTYRQNAGLDANKDGTITKLEVTAKVTALYVEGRKSENLG